jgi:hypothetical protein
MNEQINTWLNSAREYYAGVSLYEQFGSSGSQKRLLRVGGPTKHNVDSLIYELSKLAHVPVPAARAITITRAPERIAPEPVVRIQPAQRGRRQNTPEVDELSVHVVSLMKVRDQLHATLEHVSKAQRGKDALMILEISDEITECYERLDHFDKHGVLPVKEKKVERKKVNEMDVPELMKLQQNLRTYVSRYKRKMDAAKTPGGKEGHRQWMEKYQLQLAEVDEKLRK